MIVVLVTSSVSKHQSTTEQIMWVIYDWLFMLWNAALATVLFIYVFYKYRYNSWNDSGIPTLPPRFPWGNMQNPMTRKITAYEHIKNIYDELKQKGVKQCGIFSFFNQVYLPIDLDIIKNIMTKDFHHFVDRGVYFNEEDDPLSAHLVNIEGDKWRQLRAKITPTFTTGKMKQMFQTLLGCGEQMLTAMDDMNLQELDIKEVLGCYTTDVIGSCAFGLEMNSFKPDQNDFRDYGKKVMTPNLKNMLRTVFCMVFMDFAKMLRMRLLDPEISDFFMDAVKKTVEYRETHNIQRNDFLQLLIELKNDQNAGNKLTIEEIAAQCFVFFLAGFETSSTAMTFCLYELARNGEIQDKVRSEILDVLERHDQKLTYDSLGEMKYLQQALNESLRMYPSVPLVARKCTVDYELPESGKTLKKGTRVFIPIYAIQRDPTIYENPDVFDPDRFSDEEKSKRHPFSYIPFGEGPRICIGSRFGTMQSKVGLVLLLQKYRFSLNQKTEAVKLDPNGFLLTAKNTIWLNAEKI